MRLMILTDSMVIKTKPTAYGKVAFNIFKGIKDRHEVAHQPMLYANKLGLFTYSDLLVYPSGDAEFGEDAIERNCLHFNADAVLTLKDLYVFSSMMQLPLEWVPYCVNPEATVLSEVGLTPISEAQEIKWVLDGTGWTRVKKWMEFENYSKTYEIETENTILTLTSDNPVWTLEGWKPAKNLNKGEMVYTYTGNPYNEQLMEAFKTIRGDNSIQGEVGLHSRDHRWRRDNHRSNNSGSER